MEYAANARRADLPATALAGRAINGLNSFASLLDLAIRLWIASIFFKAGLTKIASWDSTLALFENEYDVPLLPSELAAYLGTGAELILPVFLAIGLLSRPAALALFVFNIVAVISYPDISPAGVSDHTHWGFLLAVTLFHGPGRISVDHFIRRRFLG